MTLTLQIKTLEHFGELALPKFETELAAGADLRAAVAENAPLTLRPGHRALVPTGATVLVVDDGSTDGTREVAEAAGAMVIDAGPLPAGWAGKTHALQVGLEHATTRVVVAVDADTRPEPGLLPALVAALDGRTIKTPARAALHEQLLEMKHRVMRQRLLARRVQLLLDVEEMGDEIVQYRAASQQQLAYL